ncbi:MAG: chorismate synthase [Alistipes sp.]
MVECTATGVPHSLGEPFFDSAESVISHLFFSIPAVKGVEFGAGFEAARMRGSHNDPDHFADGTTARTTPEELPADHQRQPVVRGSSSNRPQHLVAANHAEHGNRETRRVEDHGRHDACIGAARTGRRRSGDGIALCDLTQSQVATSIARTIGGNGIPYLPAGTPDNTEGTFR